MKWLILTLGIVTEVSSVTCMKLSEGFARLGSIRKAGLWTQANIIEPNRLMKDMERLGDPK